MNGSRIRPLRCRHVIVAVPARDEAMSIETCLASIEAAALQLRVPVTVSLAADSCTDDTAERARSAVLRRTRLEVVEGTWGRAGAARAAAVAHVLERFPRFASIWIANTDADCVVPIDWLATQLALRESVAATAGMVTLDSTTSPHLLSAFRRTYRIDGDRHPHVHGANLGVSADAYIAVGGWCTTTEVGEDHLLWNAIRCGGFPVTQTTGLMVATSARTVGRVEGGFATDLSLLDDPSAIDAPIVAA